MVVVAAAGDSGANLFQYYPYATVWAPGGGVLVAWRDNGYTYVEGTSTCKSKSIRKRFEANPDQRHPTNAGTACAAAAAMLAVYISQGTPTEHAIYKLESLARMRDPDSRFPVIYNGITLDQRPPAPEAPNQPAKRLKRMKRSKWI
ncbi:hypothetical protein ABW19_dt0207145 [Dactylella cylindrospora]|nr:hypothetical protein ABW19_dt0207145 [Dactylella cylindrospora]